MLCAFLKQVFDGYDLLENAAVGVVLESYGCDQGQVDGLFGRKMLLQGGDACPQFRFVV